MNVIETEVDRALLALLAILKQRRYHHVTPTPATHARIFARADRREAADLRDVLGWSLPFRPAILDEEVFGLLRSGEALTDEADGLLHCRYRVSTLGDTRFLHSAYPTLTEDAVLFGPDSYRFADPIRREFEHWPARLGARLVDIGDPPGKGPLARVTFSIRWTEHKDRLTVAERAHVSLVARRSRLTELLFSVSARSCPWPLPRQRSVPHRSDRA